MKDCLGRATKKVADESMRSAVEKEIQLTKHRELTVSGDGTWRTPGFHSHQGAATVKHRGGKSARCNTKSRAGMLVCSRTRTPQHALVPPAVLMNQQEQQEQAMRDQQQEQLLREQQQQAVRDQQQRQQPPRNNPGEVAEPQVNAVGNCKLPAFWRGNPELYFFQVESLFHIHHVNSDATRYHMVVAMLDPDSITEVSDIIRVPPQEDKYNTLKQTLLRRLTDPPDVQLHQLLTGVELGDKRPSQLLLHMRTLAGSRVSDEILKVRWLDLLPEQTRRLLLLIKNQSLDELAAVADEAHAMGPSVMSAGYRSQQPTSAPSLSFAAGSPDPVAQELAELRLAIVQLTAIPARAYSQAAATTIAATIIGVIIHGADRVHEDVRSHALALPPRVQAHAKVFAGTIRDMVRRRRIVPERTSARTPRQNCRKTRGAGSLLDGRGWQKTWSAVYTFSTAEATSGSWSTLVPLSQSCRGVSSVGRCRDRR
ncbi:unnamed protein product [Trichogramma brassicae]|uniref:DUF7041 domain-containing protein n=1 Tax=Trichogramma brassicae TaxID=86971 RepID=A0A6H5IY01_9HYME|nr:unnamed protein product [Trichogramma brassicae]